MQQIIFEVCAGSYQDCVAARKGGADRVELNSALSVGGLTPPLASLIRAKKKTDGTVDVEKVRALAMQIREK